MADQKAFEKSIDARGEGYTGADAMFDDSAKAAITKRKSITTKIGLPFYSEKEIEKKAGEVYSYNFNARIPFDVFKAMSVQNKKDYINHLLKKYEGLTVLDLSKMFEVSPGTLGTLIHDLGISFPRGGKRYKSEGRERFEKEMLPEPEPEETAEPAVDTQPLSIFTEVKFECDIENIEAVLGRLGMTGRVRVSIDRVV